MNKQFNSGSTAKTFNQYHTEYFEIKQIYQLNTQSVSVLLTTQTT